MTESESWAWLAGFLEGEGCWGIDKWKSHRWAMQFQINCGDRDMLERCLQVIKATNKIHGPLKTRSPHHTPMFYFSLYGGKAEAMTDQIYPLLSKRRRERINTIRAEIRANLDI